jgi:hypothetical protein
MSTSPSCRSQQLIRSRFQPAQVIGMLALHPLIGGRVQLEADLVKPPSEVESQATVAPDSDSLLKTFGEAEVQKVSRSRVKPIRPYPQRLTDIAARLQQSHRQRLGLYLPSTFSQRHDIEIPRRACKHTEEHQAASPDRHQLEMLSAPRQDSPQRV